MRKLAVLSTLTFSFCATSTAQAKTEHNWWNLVTRCESIGQRDPWYTNTGNGYYFGPQFDRGTWHRNGGGPVREMGDAYGKPMHWYSISYIMRIAENTLRAQGPYAWPNCWRYIYG